ncbi:MAG: YdcF family protein [Burkholderiales bacterium]
MNAGLLATRVLESALLPPFSLLLLLVLGIWVAKRRRRLGIAVAGLAWLALLALSLPAVSTRLKLSLEGAPLDPAHAAAAQAIVVLGGGLRAQAPEFGGDTVNAYTLERVRYGAHLHRRLNKPILVTGGNPTGRTLPEAVAMKASLAADFGVDTRWVEIASNTTEENARASRALLAPLGIERILLVTHGWHMPRSVLVFEQAGFKVIPAPTGLTGAPADGGLAWVPSATAFAEACLALREWLGMGWYRLKSALR